MNHVFVVGDWVVRFARDPRDTDDYAKEAWCLRVAAESGIPVPELVATGTTAGVPWIVQRFVPGRPGLAVWETLGAFTRRIAAIPLDVAPEALFPRFGRDLRANWQAHLDYNLAQLGGRDPLRSLGVYEPSRVGGLQQAFERLRSLDTFGLSHGDLVPGNTLVEGDRLAIIDWGSATTGPVPHFDLLRVWEAPELGEAPARAFASGYGVEFDTLEPTLWDLRLLGRIDLVRWALDRRPDRVEACAAQARETVARYQGTG